MGLFTFCLSEFKCYYDENDISLNIFNEKMCTRGGKLNIFLPHCTEKY